MTEHAKHLLDQALDELHRHMMEAREKKGLCRLCGERPPVPSSRTTKDCQQCDDAVEARVKLRDEFLQDT